MCTGLTNFTDNRPTHGTTQIRHRTQTPRQRQGAQWLNGRVLDSRPRGRGSESHRRHCVVVLEQDTFILALYWFNPGRSVPFLPERLLMGRKESNQTKFKQTNQESDSRNKIRL